MPQKTFEKMTDEELLDAYMGTLSDKELKDVVGEGRGSPAVVGPS